MTLFTVGRGDDANVTIRDPSISRVHLEVRMPGGSSVHLRDLGSTNGSFVMRGGKPVRFAQETVSTADYLVIGSRSISVAELIALAGVADNSGDPVSIYIRSDDGSFGRKN